MPKCKLQWGNEQLHTVITNHIIHFKKKKNSYNEAKRLNWTRPALHLFLNKGACLYFSFILHHLRYNIRTSRPLTTEQSHIVSLGCSSLIRIVDLSVQKLQRWFIDILHCGNSLCSFVRLLEPGLKLNISECSGDVGLFPEILPVICRFQGSFK